MSIPLALKPDIGRKAFFFQIYLRPEEMLLKDPANHPLTVRSFPG